MVTQPLILATIIVGVTALAFALDFRVPALSKVGASLMVILFGAALSNLGLVPAESPVYDVIMGPVTSLAIVWLLLAVDLRDLKRAGPRMLVAFAVAVFGTALGAFVGALVFAPSFGADSWRLAATFTGTYSGGGLNFVAVGREVELPEALFAGATAADNLTTALWLGATLVLPVWLARYYPAPIPRARESHDEAADHPFFSKARISTLDLAVLAAVGLLLVALSEWVAGAVPAVPAVLWLTTFALVVGHTRLFRTPRGALQLGTLVLHFFFVVIGIFSRVEEIVAVGVEVFLYTLVVVGVHGLVVYGFGRLRNIDVGTLSVASQAAIGGPSSALAVAVSREWKALILPGIIVGLFGYAVGNYVGLSVGAVVRSLGIGL